MAENKKNKKPLKNKPGLLKKYGYKDWLEFYESNIFKKVQDKVLKRDNYLCNICGVKAGGIFVKKNNSKMMEGIESNHLVSLCEQCFDYIKEDFLGNKNSPQQRVILYKLLKKGIKNPYLYLEQERIKKKNKNI